MTEVQRLLAEAKERRRDAALIETIRSDVGSQLFGSKTRRIANGVAVGLVILAASYDIVQHREIRGSPLWLAVIFILSLAFGYGRVYQNKTKALLRLIEKEAPALHSKITGTENT